MDKNEVNKDRGDMTGSVGGSIGGGDGGSFMDDDWELPPSMSKSEDARTEEELTKDLYKVEEEIRTLKQVLNAKERKAALIRKKLGITPLQLMGKDVVTSIKTLKDSSGAAYTDAAVNKVTNSDTMQKLNQSYAMQASKSAMSNAASYTKSSFSSIGSGMKSGFGSLKSSMFGSNSTGGGAASSTVLSPEAASDSLYAGGTDNALSANQAGDSSAAKVASQS